MREYGIADDVAMKDPQVFYYWARDPIYALKFECDEVQLDRIVQAINGTEDSPARCAQVDLALVATAWGRDGAFLYWRMRTSRSRHDWRAGCGLAMALMRLADG